MSYSRRKHEDVVFFDENSGENAFTKRLAFGKAGEAELKKYIEKYNKDHKIKNIKTWDGETYQRNVMGIDPCNKFDTAIGDIVLSKEYKTRRKVLMRIDCKWSKNSQNAVVTFHGDPTRCFNSYEDTFYATKKNDEWYAVWGQDLAMLPPDRVDIKTGDQWWSKSLISNYLVPLDEALDIFYKNIDLKDKCDLMEALRNKHHYVQPQSVEAIEEKQKAANNISIVEMAKTIAAVTNVKPPKTKDPVIVRLSSRRPGYFATIGVNELLKAERRKENTLFILKYCPRDGESDKEAKLNFDDIRSFWKTLVKGNNDYIKSIDVRDYLDVD